jgi:hypothetical protein
MSNADRSRRHKEKLAARGLTQLNLWVPPRAIPELKEVAAAISADPDLSVRLWSTKTGRTVKGRT